jgi:hypothetical protein
MRGVRLMASWVLALFLAVMFLWIGDQTLFPPSPGKNVVFPMLAEASGIYLWEPTGRLVVGVLDVLAAILLILPWPRRIGAALALAIAGGAIASHLLWLGTAIPTEFGSTETDGGQLFNLALALAVAALILVFVHPGKEKTKGAASSSYY